LQNQNNDLDSQLTKALENRNELISINDNQQKELEKLSKSLSETHGEYISLEKNVEEIKVKNIQLQEELKSKEKNVVTLQKK